jgi:type I restriction enzyme S subunit
MESKLPKNWVETNILNFADFITEKGEIDQVPYLEIGDIDITSKKYLFKDKPSVKGCKKAKKNDILISKVRPNRGAVTIVREDALNVSSAFSLLRLNNIISAKLLFHYLAFNEDFHNYLFENCTGTMYPTVSENIIKDYNVNLPPLAEQNRIVAKLDALFTQLETIEASMAKVPLLLKDFRQQVLTQAVTGKLTEEWRKGKELEWDYELAKDCCEKVQSGGTPKGSNFNTSGIPFLKVYNIVNNKIDFEYNPQYVSELIQNSQIKKSITYPGDVIMNIVGPPLNKIAIIPNDYPEWNLNQAISLFRTKKYLSNKFLYYFFCEGSSVKSLINETKGVVGQVNISLSQCRDFSIPIPSEKEQQEIVSRVESLFAKADAIEKQYETLKAKIDSLPQAILHKAFKGELTEQLDTDGDARELLREIEMLKQVQQDKSKKGKSKTNTSVTQKV